MASCSALLEIKYGTIMSTSATKSLYGYPFSSLSSYYFPMSLAKLLTYS